MKAARKDFGDPRPKGKPKLVSVPIDAPTKLELVREDVERLKAVWPWESDSIDEVDIKRVLEFMNADRRIHCVNELHRVMKTGAKALLHIPYWASSAAISDLAYEWPPIAEGWFYHLNAAWRKANNAIETRYSCDFEPTWGYAMHPLIASRNQEYQQHAMFFWKEAATGVIATLTKK